MKNINPVKLRNKKSNNKDILFYRSLFLFTLILQNTTSSILRFRLAPNPSPLPLPVWHSAQKGEGVNSLILSKSTLSLAPSPLGLSPAFGSPKERRWRGQLSSPRQRRGEDFLLPFFYLYLDKNKESLRRRWRVRHSAKREVKKGRLSFLPFGWVPKGR